LGSTAELQAGCELVSRCSSACSSTRREYTSSRVSEGLKTRVDDRTEVRQREADERGEEDEDRLRDSPAGAPEHPEAETEPADDRDRDRRVRGDDEGGAVEEVVERGER
jgi:hypothetical protein